MKNRVALTLVSTVIGVFVGCQGTSPPVTLSPPQSDPPTATSPSTAAVVNSEDDEAYRRGWLSMHDQRPVVLRDVVDILGSKPASCAPHGKWHAIICHWVFNTAHGPKRVDAYLLKDTSDPSDLSTPLAAVAWPDETTDGGAP
jgi:hypothetical protein